MKRHEELVILLWSKEHGFLPSKALHSELRSTVLRRPRVRTGNHPRPQAHLERSLSLGLQSCRNSSVPWDTGRYFLLRSLPPHPKSELPSNSHLLIAHFPGPQLGGSWPSPLVQQKGPGLDVPPLSSPLRLLAIKGWTRKRLRLVLLGLTFIFLCYFPGAVAALKADGNSVTFMA